MSQHIDVMAIMNRSVRQPEHADFVAAIYLHRENYTNGDNSGESYLVIQAARDTGTVQHKLYKMKRIHFV